MLLFSIDSRASNSNTKKTLPHKSKIYIQTHFVTKITFAMCILKHIATMVLTANTSAQKTKEKLQFIYSNSVFTRRAYLFSHLAGYVRELYCNAARVHHHQKLWSRPTCAFYMRPSLQRRARSVAIKSTITFECI